MLQNSEIKMRKSQTSLHFIKPPGTTHGKLSKVAFMVLMTIWQMGEICSVLVTMSVNVNKQLELKHIVEKFISAPSSS